MNAASDAADAAESAGTKIFAVRYGSGDGCSSTVSTNFMQNVMATDPSYYYDATGNLSLTDVFSQIADELPCDNCPDDPLKTEPGACGCGVPDVDLDGNNRADCVDEEERKCEMKDVTTERHRLTIGPEQLVEYADRTLVRLARNAARTNRALSRRLLKSKGRLDPKLRKLIEDATKQLAQLPDMILVCPDGIYCVSVDNTAVIAAYKKAVRKLAQTIIRALNRATRLVEPSITVARRKTAAMGKKVRRTRNRLLAMAEALPKRESYCTGLDSQ